MKSRYEKQIKKLIELSVELNKDEVFFNEVDYLISDCTCENWYGYEIDTDGLITYLDAYKEFSRNAVAALVSYKGSGNCTIQYLKK